jgi:hypothetical protein
MSTVIFNLTPGPLTLPLPYRGVVAPGRGAIVSDSMQTVINNIGLDSIIGMLRLEISTAPGNPANNPAPGSTVPPYDNASKPVLPSTSMPAGTEIFNTTTSSPEWVNAAGTGYVDATGSPT